MNLKKLVEMEEKELATLIKPAGYYNQKASYLKHFSKHISTKYNSSFKRFFSRPLPELRTELLSLKGIGEETADSILLYAAKKPSFVIDAYTKRIYNRMYGENMQTYSELQETFQNSLPKSVQTFNEFHALLVEHAKLFCKTKPVCEKCFLKKECLYAKNRN